MAIWFDPIINQPITDSARLADLRSLRWLESLLREKCRFPEARAVVQERIANLADIDWRQTYEQS